MNSQKIAQRARDYKIAFGTDEGQRVLNDIVVSCHVLDTTLGSSPQETAFNEGMRNAALRIMSILHYSPEDFIKLPEKVEDNV
jgi:hypothetical protein